MRFRGAFAGIVLAITALGTAAGVYYVHIDADKQRQVRQTLISPCNMTPVIVYDLFFFEKLDQKVNGRLEYSSDVGWFQSIAAALPALFSS